MSSTKAICKSLPRKKMKYLRISFVLGLVMLFATTMNSLRQFQSEALASPPFIYYQCGETYEHINNVTVCVCDHKYTISVGGVGAPPRICCGWGYGGSCNATNSKRVDAPPIAEPVTKERINSFNPLLLFSKDDQSAEYFFENDEVVVAKIINRFLTFLFPLSGMLLFVMLVWGGFEMLTGAASKKNMDAGKQRITASLFGFALLFLAWWLTWLVEFITGVRILN